MKGGAMDLIIKNATLLKNNGEEEESTKNIFIKEGYIYKIVDHELGDNLDSKEVIDATGKILIPGLINSHLHSHDRFDKGRIDNLPLELWMVAYNCPLGFREWSPEDCYNRTMLNCIEQIKSGVTTVIDDVFHSDIYKEDNIDAVFQAYVDSGLRARVTIAFSDLPYYKTIPFMEELLPVSIKNEFDKKAVDKKYVFNLWSKFAKKYQGRVRFGISTSGPQRCSDLFMKDANVLANELDLPIYSHVVETKTQQLTGHLRYGKTVVKHLLDIGLLCSKMNLVHCVWVSKDDIKIIADSGANVIHNPVSNLKLGSGIAPIADMIKSNVNVGIGTDNNNCNDSANLLEAIKTSSLISKVITGDYQNWVGAKDVFNMATVYGAKCYGAEKLGELKDGSCADLVLINVDCINYLPTNNRLYQLVYGESGNNVDTVIVGGKTIMLNRKLITCNEKEVKEKVKRDEKRIKAVISGASKRTGEILPYIEEAYKRSCNISAISSLEKIPASN